MATPENTLSSSPKSSTIPLSPPGPPPRSGSPRFNVFHRHFHSKYNPDSATTDVQPDTSVVSVPARAEAVRDAKRFLLSTVRDDWSFPPVQSPESAEEEPREPLDYRYREDGSSDMGADSDGPSEDVRLATASCNDPYRFESPDAIAVSIQNRRRKRRRVVQDEVQWNHGLQAWTLQRDMWSGAVRERPGQSITRNRRSRPSNEVHAGTERWMSADSHRTSLDWQQSPHPPLHDTRRSPSSISVTSDPSISVDESPVLLPVYAPLIPPSNPVRASIKPSMYNAIYSKVVVQGQTPTVPIPLPHMIGALVQGWKAEGNWPPNGGTPSTSIINEGPGSRRQVNGHILHFRRAHEAANAHEKGRVRRHVGGAMRKALGLSKERDDCDLPEGTGIEFEDAHRSEDAKTELEEKSGNISESFRIN